MKEETVYLATTVSHRLRQRPFHCPVFMKALDPPCLCVALVLPFADEETGVQKLCNDWLSPCVGEESKKKKPFYPFPPPFLSLCWDLTQGFADERLLYLSSTG